MSSGEITWAIVKMLLALGLLLGVTWFVLRRLQRQPRVAGPIHLLARLPLEPRRALFLVQVGDQRLLIGSSEAGLSTLAVIPHNADLTALTDPTVPATPTSDFTRLLDAQLADPSSPRGA